MAPCVLAALLLPACKEEADDYKTEAGLAYYPLEVGKFIEYQVDSTIFDPNGEATVFSTTTFVKEEIIDTLTDNIGNILYKIERFERTADSLPWNIKKVLTVSVQGNQAIRTEDNLRFVKLTFPVKKGVSWDGNIHFNNGLIVVLEGETLEMFKGWKYRTKTANEPANVGDFQFAETVTVEEANNENLIELRRSSAIYAKDIGLVYRELWILDTQCIDDCIGKTWEEKAEKGFILRQTILKHN